MSRHARTLAAQPEFQTVIQHDGSFAGFLCALAEGLNMMLRNSKTASKTLPAVTPAMTPVIRASTAGTNLFEEPDPVKTDTDRADTTWARLSRRLGPAFMQSILAAFCSDSAGADSAAASVVMRGWKEGPGVLDDLGDPDSCAVEKNAARTRAEAHLMLGAVRFAELADGSWYARLDPACDILMHIASHFSARYPLMRWAIHDTRRAKAIIHEPGKGWSMADGFTLGGNDNQESLFSPDEARVREVWRRYFGAVTIQSRLNPKLQSAHIPKKYWQNLPEMETESYPTGRARLGDKDAFLNVLSKIPEVEPDGMDKQTVQLQPSAYLPITSLL
jgi:probable DNA metabolism protein